MGSSSSRPSGTIIVCLEVYLIIIIFACLYLNKLPFIESKKIYSWKCLLTNACSGDSRITLQEAFLELLIQIEKQYGCND